MGYLNYCNQIREAMLMAPKLGSYVKNWQSKSSDLQPIILPVMVVQKELLVPQNNLAIYVSI